MDQLILTYIFAEARPISTVSSGSFRNLLQGFNPNVPIMNRRKLVNLIVDEYAAFKHEIRRQVHRTEFVTLTADIWSSRNRSFLGVTMHWLGDNLERHSVGIACKRFKGIFVVRLI